MILAVALQDFGGHPGIFDIESNDQMIVDDLVQGAVGWDLSIVGRPDVLDVNFFGGLVGHRFFRCRAFLPLGHRCLPEAAPFHQFGRLTRFGNVFPWGRGPAMVGEMGANLTACVARLHFRKARSARYRVTESALLKIDGCGSHESSSGSRQSRTAGRRVGKRNRGRFRQTRNILINNAFFCSAAIGTDLRLVAEMSQEAQNVGVLVDSNLPSRRNAYKQKQNSHRGISAYIMAGARPSGAERQIRSREFGD